MSRTNIIKQTVFNGGNVAYWMSRDQRVNDNHALIYAQKKALEFKKPLFVFFNLVPEYLNASMRQYSFMLEGLKQIEALLIEKNINFVLTTGLVEKNIPALSEKYNIDLLVTEFNPLKIKKQWINAVKDKVNATICEVDAHNIVPCQIASQKQEFSARTFRPKFNSKMHDYLYEFVEITPHPYKEHFLEKTDWQAAEKTLNICGNSSQISWIKSGESEAIKVMKHFIDKKLDIYEIQRNNPTQDVLSSLSPYLHFGQISAQRVVMEVLALGVQADGFIEEITVRRELSDNYCFYNENYDNFEGFPNWAKQALNDHRYDIRPYLYSLEQLETAQTHDALWNAAQNEMTQKGKMHGYMRMYWAKKILEWTKSPEQAQEFAIYLNDKYELDGRDPNGYTGIAWSIGGVHDRAWQERPVFGKIRYMSYNGAKSKFNVADYIRNNVKSGEDK